MTQTPEQIDVAVFGTVREKGEATEPEILEYLKKHNTEIQITAKELTRSLRRWKAKKLIAGTFFDGKVLWKMSDIPAWYMSGIMAIVKGTTNTDMRSALEALNEKLKEEGRIIEPRSVWGGYRMVEVEFENVDPLLGGWDSDIAEHLEIPKVDDKRFIPANWFKGWLRSNAGLIDLPQSICYHVQVENAELGDFDEQNYRLKVVRSMANFEAIPKQTRFKGLWSFPLRGCKLKTLDQWKAFLLRIGQHPLRGLGANPYALGGRVRLVSFRELDEAEITEVLLREHDSLPQTMESEALRVSA